MTPNSGILAGCCSGRVWVRIDGKGSHQNSGELKAFVKNQLEASGGQRVIVDLSLCTGMDSTFMGMLTCLAGRIEEAGGSLHVVNAAGRNGELLRGLGLDQIFVVDDGTASIEEPVATPSCTALPKECTDKSTQKAICLESHEALVAADERNAPKFRDVIDLMRNKDRCAALAH